MSCDPGTSDLCTQRGPAKTIHPPGPNDVTTDVRSDGTTGTIAGGVVGGLVGVVLIAVIVIVIVIIVKNKQESSQCDGSGETSNDIICHDNVVYGVNTAQPQTSTLTTGLPPSSLQEHEYDYPLHDILEPLPSVYKRVDENDDELAVNVNVSYATVPKRGTD